MDEYFTFVDKVLKVGIYLLPRQSIPLKGGQPKFTRLLLPRIIWGSLRHFHADTIISLYWESPLSTIRLHLSRGIQLVKGFREVINIEHRKFFAVAQIFNRLRNQPCRFMNTFIFGVFESILHAVGGINPHIYFDTQFNYFIEIL